MTRRIGTKRIAALFAAFAVVATTLVSGATPVNAQDASGAAALSVSPPTTSIDATPGTSKTLKIALDNISEITRDISVQVQNFTAGSNEQGQPQLEDGDTPYSLSSWVTVSPKTATLEPHKRQEFEIKIDIPKDASPGGHYGAVIFSPAAQGSSGGASLSVVPQVSSLILLRLPGDAVEKASIQGVNICTPKADATTCDKSASFFQKGPVTFTARVQNSGNVHIQPQGTITVTNIFGSKVATIKVDPKTVLPNSVRRLDSNWKTGTLFGIYKAKYDLTYGASGQHMTAEKTFYGFPVVMVAIIVALLIFGFLMFWLPRKRLKKALKAFAASDEG